MSVDGEAARPTRLGRYELITQIGQGGMAEVQLALQRGPAGFEKLVVVKLVHDNLATQKPFVDMLLDEARVAALVKHPNVVDIYDLGQAEGRYFIAMEYLEGEPLLAVLRAGREGKRLDPLSTGRLIADTAEGLDAAHELRSMSGERLELVHHDISLGNIVVLYNGVVKLVDFGVAKATQSASPSAKVQGKFSYMAPEKLKGSPGDRRSDIFSLGCVMWEALTLKRLFRGGSDHETMKQVLEMAVQRPSTVNGDVPAAYDAIVMRALERDPNRRQSTAKELAVEIEGLLSKRGYGARNDRVAKYMQETFKAHIEARQKLVQEVVSKGSASAEVLDAAFNKNDASGSPVIPRTNTGNADFTHRRVTPVAGIPGFAEATGTTEVTVSPFDVSTSVTTVTSSPLDLDKGLDGGLPQPGRLTARVRSIVHQLRTDRRARRIAGGVTGLLAFLILLVILRHHGSAPTGTTAAAAPPVAAIPAEPPVGSTPPVAVVIDGRDSLPGGSPAEVIDAGSNTGSAEASQGSDKPPVDVDHPVRPVVAVPHPATPTAEQQFQKAFQAYVKGDAKTALGLLKSARTTNPSYAPTWRLLGQVYKKLGDRGQAKVAYQRYVSLAPNASDAPAIRKELAEP